MPVEMIIESWRGSTPIADPERSCRQRSEPKHARVWRQRETGASGERINAIREAEGRLSGLRGLTWPLPSDFDRGFEAAQ